MEYKRCCRCIMDTTAPIRFNDDGVCGYCQNYESNEARITAQGKYTSDKLTSCIADIKRNTSHAGYNCILGVSGGVDSSYICYLFKQWGIRPLLVHLNNHWNAQTGEHNIQALLDYTGFDLFNYTVDWEEFREMQKAYFKASVVDVEVLTDHALMALLYQKATELGIKTIVTGMNRATEFIIPRGWNYTKWDVDNIRDICSRYSSVTIKSFPTYDILKARGSFVAFDPLQYVPYHQKQAIEIMEKEFGWQKYTGKHYESVFTKFYQAYYLPTKFGIDKRLVHLSNLIWSGQITRQDALQEIKKPLYQAGELEAEKEYVLDKLGFSNQQWEEIMVMPPVPHTFFAHADAELYEKVRLAAASYYM
ncbi:N-acetyl sugar amidotransferase [Desulfovibrio sp. OttesenSCG-928-G15]|nr:N-acetyl sugar amidotransferase [Desulfovibrio sp. OttesenSCG-928-G15]